MVYLNGKQIYRSNIPDGPINSETLALNSADERAPDDHVHIAPERLRMGRNVMAVEIHQSSKTSSDISFDLEMIQ